MDITSMETPTCRILMQPIKLMVGTHVATKMSVLFLKEDLTKCYAIHERIKRNYDGPKGFAFSQEATLHFYSQLSDPGIPYAGLHTNDIHGTCIGSHIQTLPKDSIAFTDCVADIDMCMKTSLNDTDFTKGSKKVKLFLSLPYAMLEAFPSTEYESLLVNFHVGISFESLKESEQMNIEMQYISLCQGCLAAEGESSELP